ncbi:MAG TPA: serpin family protein [Sphingobacteriaceae bacterium]|nr:serpin family protein [Sphingobacteriaceae bacterium]
MVPFFYKSALILMVVMSSVIMACDKADTAIAPQDLELTPNELSMVKQSNEFAWKLYEHALSSLKSDENAMLSPLSVQAALAMTWQGARASTREAMAEALGLSDFETEDINAYFKKLISDLPNLDPRTKLDIANSIWYRQQFQVLPEFLDVNQQFFQAEVHALDFNQPTAVDQINQWVSDQTHQKIEKIVQQLDGNLVMLLINAVYFKGDWEQKFDPEATYSDVFHHGSDATHIIHADYMKIEHTFPYRQGPDYDAVELPYGNKKYSMLAIRPKDGISITDLMVQFRDPQVWKESFQSSSMFSRKMILSFPKFTFSYANTLNDELSALGMGVAFSPAADFSGISTQGPLEISEVKHKTFIEVNEAGTEAAAVTSVGIVLTSMPAQPFELKFDKPFLFVIREVSSGLILFMGQLNNPQSENTEL